MILTFKPLDMFISLGLIWVLSVSDQEEFLRDVMQFLVIRGHTRLVPPGGLAEFPDAVLNSKRLDLFNLYREVVYTMILVFIKPRQHCRFGEVIGFFILFFGRLYHVEGST